MIDFFELYGRLFNYREEGISITTGCFKKRSRSWFKWYDNSELICVEDPQNESVDIGKASFNYESVRIAFRDAYYDLTHRAGMYDSMLNLIIRCDPSELKPKKMERF